MAGTLSGELKDMIMPHVINHNRILEASKTCNRELVEEAFATDPLVSCRNLKKKEIAQLVNDMIANTINYLPDGWKK